VVASTPDALTLVGGLPLMVRTILVLQRAGFADVSVFAGPREPSVRHEMDTRGLAGVPIVGVPDPATPAGAPGPVLVVRGALLLDPRVLAPLVAAGRGDAVRIGVSRQAPDSEAHVAVCPGPLLPALLARLAGDTPTLDAAAGALSGRETPRVPLDDGLFMPLDSQSAAPALTRALLEDLGARTAATDGYLAGLLDRHLSRAITRLLLPTAITPNQITVLGMVVAAVGGVGLATVSYGSRLAGVVALIVSSVLDGVDGELARARFQQSPHGARLDLYGDYLAHTVTFVGLGVGLVRQGLPPAGQWAALALLGGVGAAMAAMHLLVVRPTLATSGDLHGSQRPAGADEPPPSPLERLAGRDYTYVLLILALLGHLEWFLYGAAAGAWAFVAGFWLGRLRRPAVTGASPVTAD
jgi:phosphatidylglycerophosphate synthase